MHRAGLHDPVSTVLLAHDAFFQGRAKTAEAVLRYGDDTVVAVIDRAGVGRFASEVVPGSGQDIPVVRSIQDALAFEPDRLVIGVAPVGGQLPSAWRDEVAYALEQGVAVVSGMHTYLADDTLFRKSAEKGGAAITDLRKPPRDKPIYSGRVLELPCKVVLTVGTDCSSGKMTATVELARELRRRGVSAAWAATGQSGLLCSPDSGVVIDAVGADFVAGWAERIVLEAHEATGADLVLVEGQGALTHPAYGSVSLGLLHGSSPHACILCHDAARTIKSTDFHGGRTFPVLSPADEWDLVVRSAAAVREPTLAGVAIMNGGDDPKPPDALDAPAANVFTDAGRTTLADALEALL